VYALEDEPEKKGRWRRLGGGAAIATVIAAVMVFGANHFEPTRRLMQKVVQMTVVVPEPIKNLPPPRTEPPPPPPKRPPPQKQQKVATPQQQQAKPPSDSDPVGLDATSFAEGSGGPGFQVGSNQMGEPMRTAVVQKEEPKVAAKLMPVRVLSSKLPDYPRRARQLGIEGLIVIEVEVDVHGKVTKVQLRQGLEDELDRISLDAVKNWLYDPATVDGQPIASTRLLRLRYQLEN
jgi:protein TonB